MNSSYIVSAAINDYIYVVKSSAVERKGLESVQVWHPWARTLYSYNNIQDVRWSVAVKFWAMHAVHVNTYTLCSCHAVGCCGFLFL